ncbi:putative siderophore iron transporter mirB [Amylocarpus encephaloides]|uniref:Siderophore iron transporter mirB n=1 Tax=Amylocarpus encephaloides TaxID=45428 RepID=A0A9P7YIJ5_9HELO|nr:putative siderophore iron transporter mirB [Amylocarpus encephaloides]
MDLKGRDEGVTDANIVPASSDIEKSVPVNQDSASEKSSDDEISKELQPGVQKAEATASVWSKSHLYTAYVFIWIIYFVDSMQQNVTGQLSPYVTSSFQYHSLTAATSIMSSIIGGLTTLPLSKILDIWGRPQGFILMVFTMTVGLIMMAACQNVQTYAAAQVFYWVGYVGVGYCISIFIADTSSLKSRGFAYAFVSSPYIITVWIGGPIAESILGGIGFRWGFGIFAIITPVMCLPLFALFTWNYSKAKKSGVLQLSSSGRTTLQSCIHYAIEFDLIGLLLIISGMSLFLLPFSLYSYQGEGWRSPMIICMLVFGVVFLVLFGLHEKYTAKVTFIPFDLLTDRTVLGAYILAGVLFIEFYIWNSYFTSFLQVVNGLNITQTSYISNIYSIGSCFWSLIVGAAIRYTGRFKWIAVYFGVPITILGVGLMIQFRAPGVNIGYIIMCQIFIAFGGGALVICEQIAAMAACPSHQTLAVVLAVEGMFSSIGGAIGSSVSTAIWTSVFPKQLGIHLPAEAQSNLTTIYESLIVQLSYAEGTPIRDAIIVSYGEAQKLMLIAATAILVLAIPSVIVWRNINVKEHKQVKGMVF